MILVGRPRVEIEQRSKLIRAAFKPVSALRDKLFEKAHGICILCHRPMQKDAPNEIDHLISVYFWAEQHEPIEEMIRRANEENNLALVHSECNTAKSTLEWEEFARLRDAGEIVVEPRWYTPEEIERQKRWLSKRGRKGGRIAGAIAVKSGQLLRLSSLGGLKRFQLHGPPSTPEGRIKGALATNHIRWHVQRNIKNPRCELCR
jgi:5-methylcytosine-specific restriction endonuclease McrA